MKQIILKHTNKILAALSLLLLITPLFAKENEGKRPRTPPPPPVYSKAADCAAATAKVDLDVNNVRTKILNGGDMWWDLSNAKYEVPKVGTGQVAKHSMFAGALWIGGVTNGNLRIAAQTYRQSGNDFYPGPLTIGTASISQGRCKEYDRIWKITLDEIDAFRNNPTNWGNPTDVISTWPVHVTNNIGEAATIAPFFDEDGDGLYNPNMGDYPSFDQNVSDNIPDMMLFLICNDKGNIHSETQGVPIGLELQIQTFGYATNDEVNNMTFYRTTVINRGSETIDSCIFGQWVDPDLGNYSDDYVECNVIENLGICYNGDDDDQGQLGYGLNPPSVGVRFFEGPTRPDGSEIGLTKFVYYNNDFSDFGNPSSPAHYWNYLNGKWKNGNKITYGGNGQGAGVPANFMFPGKTDTAMYALHGDWTERIAGNTPGDRRFLQTAGPFSLLSGAVNRVTIGVVWARATSGGATGSFGRLLEASRTANILFKSNFKIADGPPAPKLEIVELPNKLIFKMLNTETIETFEDSIPGSDPTRKTVYKFQGYLVYQLPTPNLPNDFYDMNQARLVAQFDVADNITRLIDHPSDPDLGERVGKLMVTGDNKGIKHTFALTKDYFETGSDQTLVNFKNYHYLILSYAANEEDQFKQFLAGRNTLDGKAGITIYTATPHFSTNNGIQLNSDYGMGLPVTALEGIGNGGNFLELSDASINEALSSATGYMSVKRKYKANSGPVNVRVIDPFKVPIGTTFTLWLRDSSTDNTAKKDSLAASRTYWFLRNNNTGEVKSGVKKIDQTYEQVIDNWGISVIIAQSVIPGNATDAKDISNGYLDAKVIWSNPADNWLSGVKDEDPNYSTGPYAKPFNWIRAGQSGIKGGIVTAETDAVTSDFADPSTKEPIDPNRKYSQIINSTWAPYSLAARRGMSNPSSMPTFGPAWAIADNKSLGAPTIGSWGASVDNSLKDLDGIDFVITPDRSKWTRCLVIETGEDFRFNQGNADKMDARQALSVDKYGRNINNGGINNPVNPEAANYLGEQSLSWFPGYAIDVETGERLNIMFGENSSLPTQNGADMIWNPTSNLLYFNPVFGGGHYIYVMKSKRFVSGLNVYDGPRYDGGVSYAAKLDRNFSGSPSFLIRKRQVYSQAIWTSMPVLTPGSKMKDVKNGLVPSEVTFKIRVKKPYASYYKGTGTTINDSLPLYTFSTEDFAPNKSDAIAKKALDNVAVIPNPYYAYSAYEDKGNQLDNRVRITNLPSRCVIRIYTMDGVLVRTIKKDDASNSYLEWDLKNDAKVPIASGIYLVHINAPDLGEERIVKWFGIMRPADYDSF